MSFKQFVLSGLLATAALAKTDIGGCVTTNIVTTATNGGETSVYTTLVYYLPDTGEICELLDCGGGRAPPKTTVPGCAAYKGTETYSPKFLPTSTSEAPEPAETSAGAESSESGDAQTSAVPTPSANGTGSAGGKNGNSSETGSGSTGAGKEGEFNSTDRRSRLC